MNGVKMQQSSNNEDVQKNVPRTIVDAVDAAVRAGQQYASAVANQRGIEKCEQLMTAQKDAVNGALQLISAELGRRYEAGIEMGRAQASSARQ